MASNQAKHAAQAGALLLVVTAIGATTAAAFGVKPVTAWHHALLVILVAGGTGVVLGAAAGWAWRRKHPERYRDDAG